MRTSLLAVFSFVFPAAIGACGGRVAVTPFGEFRHTLLVPSRIDNLGSGGGRLRLEPPSEVPVVRCQEDFRHPVLNRCETWPGSGKTPSAEVKKVAIVEKRMPDPERGRALVVERARAMLSGRGEPYRVGDKVVRKDCSGLVMAAYSASGFPLEAYLSADTQKGESLVARLYRGLAERGRIHEHKVPEVGDLVFFDNTFDRNRDGRANDPLTHVGIVESVKADGTVIVIHHARGGALRTRLNLFHPKMRRDPKTGQALNHYLRFADGSKKKRLAGELFAGFATVIH